jgi:hypothetical protein
MSGRNCPRRCVRYDGDGIEGCAIGGSARCPPISRRNLAVVDGPLPRPLRSKRTIRTCHLTSRPNPFCGSEASGFVNNAKRFAYKSHRQSNSKRSGHEPFDVSSTPRTRSRELTLSWP